MIQVNGCEFRTIAQPIYVNRKRVKEVWVDGIMVYPEADMDPVLQYAMYFKFGSKVLLQGCGPVGLMQIAVLKAAGVVNIIAVDGVETRLALAKEMGATHVINFRELKTIEERVAQVQALTKGFGADFVFQCTGVPQAAADAYKYVRRGGGYCEMGFFVNAGECTMNPHFDLCNKEITLVGSWVYSAQEYIHTLGFLTKAKEMGIPVEKLVTHHYKLDESSG